MRIALYSDIHGNLEALTAVAESFRETKPERVVFLGDVVGYGANPNECISLVRELSDGMLAGNHDWAACAKSNIEAFNPVAKKAIHWTRSQMTAENRLFLEKLPLRLKMKNLLFVHATPAQPEGWGYIFNAYDATLSFNDFPERVCFIGHTHYPAVFQLNADKSVTQTTKMPSVISDDYQYIINNGSVGQPRDGDPRASYGLLDTDTREYRWIRVAYAVKEAQRKIINAGLDEKLALRLGLGR